MSLDRPNPFLSKWAENGKRFDVPDSGADTANGRADIQTGFPEITMRSVINGGVPPWGKDHNGILHQITQAIQWTQAGGLPTFNQDFSNRNGGYAAGTILQGEDTSKPWILWICLEDNNKNDPKDLKINNPAQQSGWRRYPVIENKDGTTLYYNDEGELAIYTAQSSYVLYVSWSSGSDTDNFHDGSRAHPYKTIDMAVSKSPSSGQVIIKILDTDNHYVVGRYDKAAADISQYTPGNAYTKDMGVKDEPYQTISGSINVGIRNILIQPYNNPNGDPYAKDGWEEYITMAGKNTGDAWWGYCITDDALALLGLKRPTIYKMWCYCHVRDGDGVWSTWSMRYCGFDGVQGSFSVGFLGCKLSIYNLNELENTAFVLASAFERVGGTYMYNGCVINTLCEASEYNQASMGGSDLTTTNVTFRRHNYFVDADPKHPKSSIFISLNSQITITSSDNHEANLPGTNYPYITNNAMDYLKRSTSYSSTTLTTVTQFNVKRYAYLNVNYTIT